MAENRSVVYFIDPAKLADPDAPTLRELQEHGRVLKGIPFDTLPELTLTVKACVVGLHEKCTDTSCECWCHEAPAAAEETEAA